MINWYKIIKAMPLPPSMKEYPTNIDTSLNAIQEGLSQETIDDKLEGERSYLGHGYWGTAYDTPGGFVEKISRGHDDYRNALEIMKKQEETDGPLPFCVEVYDAQIIQENPIFYKFIIEKVEQMKGAVAEKFNNYYRELLSSHERLSFNDLKLIQKANNIPDDDMYL